MVTIDTVEEKVVRLEQRVQELESMIKQMQNTYEKQPPYQTINQQSQYQEINQTSSYQANNQHQTAQSNSNRQYDTNLTYNQQPQTTPNLTYNQQLPATPNLIYNQQSQTNHNLTYNPQLQANPNSTYNPQPQANPNLIYNPQLQANPNLIYNPQAPTTPNLIYNPQPQYKQDAPESTYNNSNTFQEAVIGKYFIGAIASILVFVGAISLVGLVWDQLTSEIKLALLASVGVALTAIGFWRIRVHRNPISSIVLGTGSGLLFISILSANMAFHLVNNPTTIVLVCVWAIVLILSSRCTNVYFTTIIAYLGSYIALLFGLFSIKSNMDYIIMIIFVTIVCGVMIIQAYKDNDPKKLIASIILTLISYGTLLIRACYDSRPFPDEIQKDYAAQAIVLLILYVLLNILYKLLDVDRGFFYCIGISVLNSIITAGFLRQLGDGPFNIDKVQCFALFFSINLIQLIINNILLEHSEKQLSIFYGIILIVTSILLNRELFDASAGIVMVAVIFFVLELIYKEGYDQFISGIVVVDAFFLIIANSSHWIFFIFGGLQIALTVYLLYKSWNESDCERMNQMKVIGLIVILFNSYAIPRNLIEYGTSRTTELFFESDNFRFVKLNAVGYLITVVCLGLLGLLGYFKDWTQARVKIFDRKCISELPQNMKSLLYITTTLLYFLGLKEIVSTRKWDQQFLFTIAVIAIALIQTYVIIRNKKAEDVYGEIWIGIKYLVLIWVLLRSFYNLDFNSVLYSITGLSVAIASISLGFLVKFKNLRLYGLILTIIMAVKFILVDLSEENSITRVLALIIGGLICFGISVIYNIINTKTDE